LLTDRNLQIKRAAWIAIIGNTILAVLKVVLGLISGSMAVIGDGIDTTTDIIISSVILIAAGIIARPPDKMHPYGHNRAEVIATKVVSFFIFFAGAQLALKVFMKILEGTSIQFPSVIAIYVTLGSIVGKILLSISQFRSGKKTQSPMLIANGKNMFNDIFISVGVMVGLMFTFLIHLPIIDSIVAFAISIWIMKTAVKVFMETNIEIMDGVKDHSLYDTIFTAVNTVEDASNPHRTRIRQLGNMYVIDLDIEVDDTLSVSEAHKIAVEVEEKIKGSIGNVYDIIVHVEPLGNIEVDEKYGLSDSDIK